VTNDGVALLVEDLRVTRGDDEVVHGLTFEVAAGEILGLLGPSGSGKSTLIRAVVGVQRHTAGRCEIFGLPAGSAALRQRVGYMTQSPAVYGDLTVVENLRYFARLVGSDPSGADHVIEQVDLVPERDRQVGSLSGGQTRRVSLAAALLGRPELLLLDEPTVGLDPVLRRNLWEIFHRLAATGTTLIVSSHVMDEARECDRLLLLREGLVVADGTETDLLARTGATDIGSAFLHLVEREQP
jgi:ABC-2 type transport system ATP-binding protein